MVSQSTVFTLLAILVTTSVWDTDPLLTWGYEIAIFAVAGWAVLGAREGLPRSRAAGFAVAGIGLWGLVQLADGSTVYRWATVNVALYNLALAAAAAAAFLAFRTRSSRTAFLRRFCWFGVILGVVCVLSYWTSPGKILWIFPALYPDNWGPFPSRNNFAQFLELSFPVALWEMGRTRKDGAGRDTMSRWAAAIPPAILLGAGLASASRAGAVLLIGEGVCALTLLRRRLRTPAVTLVLASTAVASVAGAGVLVRRLTQADPWQVRREIFRSTAAMIKARVSTPGGVSRWTGYGLGSFATVYPQFAEFDTGASVEHAHSDWLEWLAEGGPLYAGMWLALAGWSVRPALRSVWGLGVPAVFVHASVDYPFARLGISMWVFLLIGALAREVETRESETRESEKSRASDALSEGSIR